MLIFAQLAVVTICATQRVYTRYAFNGQKLNIFVGLFCVVLFALQPIPKTSHFLSFGSLFSC
jgi:hypothetical protein